MKIEARPWRPQDLLDDLQGIIDEESDNYLNTRRTTLEMALAYLKEHFAEPKWIPVTEQMPDNFTSVLGYMSDAGDFPAVRECYTVGYDFYFPALHEVLPVSHWQPMPDGPKEDKG